MLLVTAWVLRRCLPSSNKHLLGTCSETSTVLDAGKTTVGGKASSTYGASVEADSTAADQEWGG